MMRKQIILGLDPGYADTGWGVIESENRKLNYLACGSIQTKKSLSLADRLLQLEQELTAIIEKYTPTVIGVEQIFFNTNTTTAIKVAQARGVLLLLSRRYQIRLVEPTPLQIKQALTSSGAAPKAQVGKMVKTLLRLSEVPRPDDAADALACAIYTSFQQ